MRQHKFDYSEYFKKGLVSDDRESGFIRLQNLYPWKGSLRYLARPSMIEALDSASQIFRIGINSFRCSTTGVEKLVEGAYTAVIALESSTVWSCLNFIKFGVLTDGVSKVYVDENGACSLIGTDFPKATSSCDLNGQVVVGGLDGSWNSLDRTYVAWSKIGLLDFTVDKTNEAGFHNPDIGIVYSVLKFGKDFIALGASGVAHYSPAAQSFGYRKLGNVGISGTLNAASNGQEVYYVDKLGDLIQINSSNGATNLGYRWIFKGHSAKLHWAESENELRIVVDNSKTYVLNTYGLYETNIVILGSTVDGLYSVYGSQALDDAYFETADENADVSGLKSVTEVYVEDTSSDDKTVSIVSTVGRSTNRSREQLVNHLGIAVPNIAVDRFRISYRVEDYTDGQISSLYCQTVKTDGRFGTGYSGTKGAKV